MQITEYDTLAEKCGLGIRDDIMSRSVINGWCRLSTLDVSNFT